MDKAAMIRLAKRAIDKKWDFETLKYGDDLYGKEQFAEEVWAFVEECEEIGTKAFFEKYHDAFPPGPHKPPHNPKDRPYA